MYHCFRLKKDKDLKKEIENYAIKNNVSGVILSSVGSLSKIKIRLADGKTIMQKSGQFEIVSINGTLSKDGVYLHISLSDEEGRVIGGHLKDGCIINTTAEICLVEFDDIIFERKYDDLTGYNELEISYDR